MTSNMKALLFILGSVLVIFGGEAMKQSLASWADVTKIQFIAGLCIQVGGLIGAIVGSITFDPSSKTFINKKE